MKAEAILSAMNYIDEDILFAVENRKDKRNKVKGKTQHRLLIAAACIVFTAVSAVFINTVISNSLPKLDLKISKGDGMGFEGAFLKNPDDFESGNPWEYSVFTSRMPVYESNSHDEKGTPCGLNEIQLDKTVDKAVSALGAKTTDISKAYANDLYGGYKNDFVYSVTAETDIASITANAAGGLSVFFSTPITLPFDFNAENAAEYYTDKYSDLISSFIGFEKPEISISTEYNAYGETHRSYRVYDASGNKKEDVINYNLNYAELRIENDGTLTSIYICNSESVTDKIAVYPIITEFNAEKKLIAGDYISSVVQYDFPGKEYIAKTDLVYKSEKGETVAPYYRFIVELPEAPDDIGIKSYGIYYVPAVKDKYISGITLIDGEIQ
ncbi:MAG: hypothetical protein J6J45_06375 [Clostridia bacterium]|nr:hypothetical protein [Clostridia bacterium]